MSSKSNIFLQIPNVIGSSIDDQFNGAIELYSFDAGIYHPVQVSATGGISGGETGINPVNVSFAFGKHSMQIIQLFNGGTIFNKVTISFRKSIGTTAGDSSSTTPSQALYFQYTLGTAIITFSSLDTISLSGGYDNNTPVHRLTFATRSSQMVYAPQKFGDHTLGPSLTAAWDVQASAAQLSTDGT